MSSAGVSAPKRGRPRDDIGFVRIKLKRDVYDIWNSRKESVELSNKTHSDFARYLLLNFCENEAGHSHLSRTNMESPDDGKY